MNTTTTKQTDSKPISAPKLKPGHHFVMPVQRGGSAKSHSGLEAYLATTARQFLAGEIAEQDLLTISKNK